MQLRSNHGITFIEIVIGLSLFFTLFVGVMIFLNVTRTLDYPSCSVDTVILIHPLLDKDDYDQLLPMGYIKPSEYSLPMQHMTFVRNSVKDGHEHKVPVFMPGNGWIEKVRINYDKKRTYSVFLRFCSEVSGYVQYLETLRPRLQKLVDESACTQKDVNDYCDVEVNKPLGRASEIGFIGESDTVFSLDFGVIDIREQYDQYANEIRWNSMQKFTTCPLNYFTRKIIDDMYAALPDKTRELASKDYPYCGKASMDVAGSLRGVWFSEPYDFENESSTITFVYNVTNPQVSIISLDNSFESKGMPYGTYSFTATNDDSINRSFEQANSIGSTYCYHQFEGETPGSIHITLIDENTISVLANPSTNCFAKMNVEQSEPITFYR